LFADYADNLFCLTMRNHSKRMFVGHYAIGFGAKRWAPKTSVGTLMARSTISLMTKERWAQLGITIEFLVIVRTLAEFFRIRHVHDMKFSAALRSTLAVL
jgi:hypothetical protein